MARRCWTAFIVRDCTGPKVLCKGPDEPKMREDGPIDVLDKAQGRTEAEALDRLKKKHPKFFRGEDLFA